MVRRDWRLDQISPDTFESLVGHLCQELLGVATLVFGAGRDGGRDARFTGTAQAYPSTTAPWTGQFVIQAKHTSDRNASCSDRSFFGNASSILARELPKISALRTRGELDHYLLFTNRKLIPSAEEAIRNAIRQEAQVENAGIHGIENIASWLRRFPHIAEATGLNLPLGPIRFFSADLEAVVKGFAPVVDELPLPSTEEFGFATLDEKNRRNHLRATYFKVIRDRSAAYFQQIRDFLRDPRNEHIARRYQLIAGDLNEKVMARRDDFAHFDHVFGALVDLTLEQSPELASHRDLLRVFLHFMYWDCDLGER